MFHGGGKMVVAAEERACGAGHFGRYIIDEGVEVMSFHWEADFELSGRSTLAVRPLVWKNGWPVVGDNFKGGNLAILSERRGYALELAVDFVRIKQERQGWFNREQMQQPAKPIASQTLDEVKGTWPQGDIPARIGDYMFRPHQRWAITPVNEAGGYLSNPYFKITIEGTERALAATADKEVTTVPAYMAPSASCRRPSRVSKAPIQSIAFTPQATPHRPLLSTISRAIIPSGTSATIKKAIIPANSVGMIV